MDLKKFLADYVTYQSVSSDFTLENGMAGARKYLIGFFNDLAIEAREVKFGKHAAIFAKTAQKSDKPTILVYGHYDVQPADDVELWTSDPFILTEKDGRWYARGASDNKGCHSAVLVAIHDLMTTKRELPVNLKFILEGEEEIGSCSMPQFLRSMKDELTADFALVVDTCSLDKGNIVITTGLRGIVGCEVKLKGQDHDLHSGYGGCLLNPIGALVDLCSVLHTTEGLVNVPGFYDEVAPPYDWEREQMKHLPMLNDELKESLGIKHFKLPHGDFSAAETIRFLPTLEFNGIRGGFQGTGIKTIIPSYASVKISCRLVPNQNAEKIKNLLAETITNLCPKEMALEIKFEQTSNPYLFDAHDDKNEMLSRATKIAEDGIKSTFGNPPLYLREGGSIGLVSMLKEILGIDSLLIGLSTAKDNIHAPDESVEIAMLERGRNFFREFFSKF
ncbi:MAG: M20/M25/M40 family metallo-hydrolase [Puniceicoccales bacterium]|jgi:acetylornithine deacetylase/succinyl-diaminopimelate desuccinylase-like protein|nr:M20/M25/M40 family metallo-hydrolase [Puniceicoccales bacterium]